MKSLRHVLDYLWRLVASGLSFSLATLATAAVLTVIGLQAAPMPPGSDPHTAGLIEIALCPLLALGLAPLAAGMSGSYRARWLSLAFLVFINLGANTGIEAAIYSTMFAKGGLVFMFLMYAGGGVALGAVLARLFRPSKPASEAEVPRKRGVFGWAWRCALAVVAFPVIYLIFGFAVTPFVMSSYRAGVAGLVIPPFAFMLSVQLFRSLLFLLAALPVIFLWARSRRGLVLALGWAFTVTVGLYGLLAAYWLPTVLRVAHSLEITADSFVYAFVLVMLFKRRDVSAQLVEPATHASATMAA